VRKVLYAPWQRSQEIGIPILDEQHRGLFAAINAISYFGDHRTFAEAMKKMIALQFAEAQLHFETEETLMRVSGFPETENHVQVHEQAAAKMQELGQKAVDTGDPGRLVEFLRKYWVAHIDTEDRKYVRHVRLHLGLT
jgi:hemerythrin